MVPVKYLCLPVSVKSSTKNTYTGAWSMYPLQHGKPELLRWRMHQWGISFLDSPLLKQSGSFNQNKCKKILSRIDYSISLWKFSLKHFNLFTNEKIQIPFLLFLFESNNVLMSVDGALHYFYYYKYSAWISLNISLNINSTKTL